LPTLSMSPEVRHNVYLASKEAITNVVRHAKATAVWIRLRLDSSSFTIEIEDNGCGIADPNAPTVRNGLRNMRKRMDDIGGKFVIGRGKECGALVQLTVPITSNTVPSASAK
jgi:signal transduction histidine kinase